MIVIEKGFIPLSPLSLVSIMVMWESSKWLAGFCPEIKSIGTNGPLSLEKVGHFRKYGALAEFPNHTRSCVNHI